MALSDKDIIITPNRGQSADPKIEFRGADGNTGPLTITAQVYPNNNGTLSFEGSAGQLFSITNDLSGTIFSVNDVSGIPSLEVNADGTVSIAEFGGNVGIGNTAPAHKLRVDGDISLSGGIHANGSLGTSGHVLHSNGTATYWAADDQGVTSVATGNGLTGGTITTTGTISVIANNGLSANATGIYVVPGNGLIASNSTGVHVGQGTGVTVNSTTVAVNASYIATISSNNASFLGGTAAASYQLNSTLAANVATLTANNSTNLNGQAASYYTNATNLASGTVPTARLGSGTANSTTFLAGDQSWKTISGGATLTANNTDTQTFYIPMANATSGSWSNGVVSDTKLYFVPSTGTLNATIFNSLSDETLKKDVENISDALELVTQMRGIKFTWKDSEVKSSGVLAQELEKITPDLVNTNNSGIKSVNYDGIIAYLIEAVKEIKDRLDTLNK